MSCRFLRKNCLRSTDEGDEGAYGGVEAATPCRRLTRRFTPRFCTHGSENLLIKSEEQDKPLGIDRLKTGPTNTT